MAKSKSKKLQIPIKVKLVIIGSLIVLFSVSTLTYIALDVFAKDMRNLVKHFISRETKLLAEKVEAQVNIIAERQRIINNNFIANKKNKQYMASAQRSYFSTDSDLVFSSYHKITGKARRLGASKYSLFNKQIIKKKKLSRRGLIHQSLRQKQFIQTCGEGKLNIVNSSNIFRFPSFLMCIPIISHKNILNGIVITLVKMRSIEKTMPALEGGKNSVTVSMLIESSGHALVHPQKRYVLESVDLSKHPAVAEFLSSKSTSKLFSFKRKENKFTELKQGENKEEEIYASIVQLNVGYLGVITTIAESRALEGVNKIKIAALLISIIVLCIAILLTFLFAKTISDPLKQLVNAANKIREGIFDLNLKSKTRDEVGDLTNAFNEMAKGLREREQLKGALTKFVNPIIAEQALKGEITLGGEKKTATIFFSDIRSFTAISEKLSPEEVVEFLNEYMTLMVDIIDKSHGVVDKFIGDAIMAVWGVPVSHGTDAKNCVEAALLMRKALIKFNASRGTEKKPIIQIGSGINTGACIAGQIGSDNRLEYTVIGDAVNLASRVEALNKPFGTDVLISQQTYAIVSKHFKTIAMDKIKVKGKTKPQQIYAVLGHKNDKNCPKNLKELRKLVGIKIPPKSKKSVAKEQKYEILTK